MNKILNVFELKQKLPNFQLMFPFSVLKSAFHVRLRFRIQHWSSLSCTAVKKQTHVNVCLAQCLCSLTYVQYSCVETFYLQKFSVPRFIIKFDQLNQIIKPINYKYSHNRAYVHLWMTVCDIM